MHELRLQLAQARADLRSAKDDYELIKAQAEQRAIEAGEASGKNAEERARSLLLAINKDDQYLVALAQLRYAENEVERLDALLDGAIDARRAEEWTIRARMTAVREQSIQGDADKSDVDGYFDDDAQEDLDAAIFDDGMDQRATYAVNDRAFYTTKRPVVYEEDLPF